MTSGPQRRRRAFTVTELLVTLGIVALLGVIAAAAYQKVISVAQGARCAGGLRNLGAAAQLYTADHGGFYFPYVEPAADGRIWYFGKEPSGGARGEGERELEKEAGPLYPYLQQVGTVEICPAFDYRSDQWKAKFNGASWGYGYNWRLGGKFRGAPLAHVAQLSGGDVILFGDCAQINSFQAPASPDNPMLEEFYIIDEREISIHFRHGGTANFVFADGSVRALKPEPGTGDPRLPGAGIGRISPRGSLRYLE